MATSDGFYTSKKYMVASTLLLLWIHVQIHGGSKQWFQCSRIATTLCPNSQSKFAITQPFSFCDVSFQACFLPTSKTLTTL
jgi:hypothetical protein